MNQTSMSKWYFLSVYGVVTANALVLVEQRFTWQQRCRSEVFKVKPTSAQTPKRWVLLAAKAMLKKTPTLTGKATERHFEHPCSRQQSYKLFSLCVIRVHNTGCHFFFFFSFIQTHFFCDAAFCPTKERRKRKNANCLPLPFKRSRLPWSIRQWQKKKKGNRTITEQRSKATKCNLLYRSNTTTPTLCRTKLRKASASS